MAKAAKSTAKSAGNPGFKPGPDPRRGRGPAKGAPNAGRPPNALRAICRDLTDKYRLPEIAAKIAIAEIGEQFTTGKGEVLYADTKNTDRIAAIKLILSYGEGMPAQSLDLTSKGESMRPVIIRQEPA